MTNANSIRELCIVSSLLQDEAGKVLKTYMEEEIVDIDNLCLDCRFSSARRNTVTGRVSSVNNLYTFEKTNRD